MKVLGLTGKTGAGKSTVALTLKSLGCYIIDGDIIARQITQKGSPVLSELQKTFGDDVLGSDGCLIRPLLAERAFSSRESTDLLNSITHPVIKKKCAEEIEKAEKEGYSICVIDAAALLDSDCCELCEKIIVVHAPVEIRLERILQRDSISPEQARLRIKAQKSDEYYLSRADIVIENYPPFDSDGTNEKILSGLMI